MLPELTGQQMLLGDLHLLLQRIARHLDQLHAVEQRLGNILRAVGRGDEQHLRQIERRVEIVIGERVVLRRIERLQHGRGRIAAEIAGHLVDLVEQEHGISCPALPQPRHDATGLRADIGAAMAANLGFVMQAAQRHAHILALERARNRSGDRRFAHAGRADQTENRAFHIPAYLADRQILENALLDLFKAVMIGFEHPARPGHVDFSGRLHAPRHIEHPVDIVFAHNLLRRARGHTGQTVDLAARLFPRFVVHFGLFKAAAHLLDAGGFVVAQLFLHDLELLAQIIFALMLIDVRLGLFLDFVLDARQLALLVQHTAQQLKPQQDVPALENLLLVLHLAQRIGGDHVGQRAGIRLALDHLHHLARHMAARARQQRKERLGALGIADQLFLIARHVAFDSDVATHPVMILVVHIEQQRAVFALADQTHHVVARGHDVTHARHRAHGVQIGALGLLAVHVALRHEQYVPVSLHRRFQRGERTVAPHIYANRRIGKDRQPAQRQQRQLSLNLINVSQCPYPPRAYERLTDETRK